MARPKKDFEQMESIEEKNELPVQEFSTVEADVETLRQELKRAVEKSELYFNKYNTESKKVAELTHRQQDINNTLLDQLRTVMNTIILTKGE